jgi:hypothetical protein
MRAMCRHCGRKRGVCPRSMCWTCYHTPGLRGLYPSTSKFARRGEGQGFRADAPDPPGPTAARPGSPEKVLVLAGRAAAGWSLWHPADAEA